MWVCDQWKDYELIDARAGEKLERWGNIILRRPDPTAIWNEESAPAKLWNCADAVYHRSSSGGGSWEYKKKLPQQWDISYRELKFHIKTMGFKHTGLFPEQAVNWDWCSHLIRTSGREIRVLNLFAYTGGASAAACAAGASVVHVDAAKGMVAWAKENVAASCPKGAKIRYLVDDVTKLVLREIRRGNQYDAIIMDPPSYGRGPSGEVWKVEEGLYPLVTECVKLLSPNPLFFLINSYTAGLSPSAVSNVLQFSVKKRFGGRVTADEVGLRMSSNGLFFPCGTAGRWETDKR